MDLWFFWKSLSIGMAGYHWIGGLPWIDAFLDAAMILSGMGPLSQLHTDAAKLPHRNGDRPILAKIGLSPFSSLGSGRRCGS